jgi:UDP-glucuronate 4-epimerase
MNKKFNILITGNAGFIGMHLFNRLRLKHQLTGIDNLNDYYDVTLKIDRLRFTGFNTDGSVEEIMSKEGHLFYHGDLANKIKLAEIFSKHKFDIVIHLAAQAGVRYSITNPDVYIKSNINGFFNVLELSRQHKIKHFIYASSSSVYGLNEKLPFSVNDPTDHPVSLYGATKRSNELMAHTYSHLFNLPVSGLRFFTVYGPFGRPDMAIFKFTKNILSGIPIDVFNNGEMKRDFTYVDDVCESIERLISLPPVPKEIQDINLPPGESSAPFRIFNIGNQKPMNLLDFIHAIEKSTGKKAIINYKPLQPGDVLNTFADVSALSAYIGFYPETDIEKGIDNFIKWYRSYYLEN